MNPDSPSNQRREFLKTSSAAVVLGATHSVFAQSGDASALLRSIDFKQPDSLYHGHEWETLNPGYWQIKNGALRRRLSNYGDRARRTGFPFHYETHRRNEGVMNVEYDPSLPHGIIYHREWKLRDSYSISATFTYHGSMHNQREGDSSDWKMYQWGYGQMGLAIGAKCLFESYGKNRNTTLITWTDDGRFQIEPRSAKKKQTLIRSSQAVILNPGDQIKIVAEVRSEADKAKVTATIQLPDGGQIELTTELPARDVEGYVGVVGRGYADFEMNSMRIDPGRNKPLQVGYLDCYTCYPLGDTLTLVDGKWKVRFVGLFASDGKQVEMRVSEEENPSEGWAQVPVAGTAEIVNNRWRRNTSSIEVTLPGSPAETTFYYTVWKDGKNVTSDPRIGSDACGPGTGFVGDVPAKGNYVGRLPKLAAPYKICGLSCHAITSGLQQRTDNGLRILGGGDDWQFRDQPTVEAYKHLEDYDFQVMCWEDDVWYMELVLYPPSTDDAYKMVATTIAGPTSRWQMMRHWNVINPGDHDYGMDDVKGPEQLVIRLKDGLGQDRDYMRRNFQIVQHLITGSEDVDPRINPKKWRAWKMPHRDFTFVILDSRLWRSSQDTAMWDDEGWGHMREIYDRADPTRSLLGEEQFAWLQELVRTDSSPLICLTGINGMHTVWTGGKSYSNTDKPFAQRDRVAADYAGWVAAGADRVIELLGSRDGIVTVYGDVHNGCILKNKEHRLIECSFGPIGRSGGRAVIPGFGPTMQDFDGRDLDVTALYHSKHANPNLEKQAKGEPFYWNFLEMEFDPRGQDPSIGLRIRNMIDPPHAVPRGGSALETTAKETGRPPLSTTPVVQTLANADVRMVFTNGRPIRGIRSDKTGRVPSTGLADVPAGTQIIVTAFDGETSKSTVVTTQTYQASTS